MKMHPKFTSYLLLVNLSGIGITVLFCLYLLILFPSVLNPYGEIALENTAQYTNPAVLEHLFEEIANWVEASNNRSKFLVVTMLIFLLFMIAIFLINLSFIRVLKKELTEYNGRNTLNDSRQH